ncbi:MAG: UpxY family transcription antiterminator [Proteobacteria bacterium]|nr:UpxY family transcription antiterminator [Pseudomonadota bacterium]MBU1741940.1 UpxY family transcription antiterminator [Pseudomonadota bacterium]
MSLLAARREEDIWAADKWVQPRWFAVYTKSRFEQTVEQRLRDRAFECFLPRVKAWSRRRDRRLEIDVPAFPGYLFVRTSLMAGRFYDLITVPGLVRLVSVCGRPVPVPDEDLESIRLLMAQRADLKPHPFVQGDKVEVVAGPLKGARGIIQKIRAKRQRLIVALDLLHRAVSVELDDLAVELVRG